MRLPQEIYYEEGALEKCPSFLPKGGVIVIDENLKELYGVGFAKKIGAPLLTIPSGEAAKRFCVVERVLNQLFELGIDRETTLIAVGGGSTTDLVGFVASIALRGLPLVLIPTTLLAMVDAAIGGKTGVNCSFGKNLIGSFYPPKQIVIDPNVLTTLPKKEYLAGLAEIWKLGLVLDLRLWKKKDILLAIQGKLFVTEKDPKEQGFRRILNFGHTIGHALEKVSNFQISHGEAVLMGCATEAHLSQEIGLLQENEFCEIEAFYVQFFSKLPATYSREKLLDAMRYDKKVKGGEVRFVLIDKIGHAASFEGAYCRAVSFQELEKSLAWLESHCG
ncbi:MAG: 3-dehydroquinate synthase [Chlamydiia bacterium]|nr:3-dehydroquinate synthase [Chlamydiia bacterium]